jgi:hypothetical protein
MYPTIPTVVGITLVPEQPGNGKKSSFDGSDGSDGYCPIVGIVATRHSFAIWAFGKTRHSPETRV